MEWSSVDTNCLLRTICSSNVLYDEYRIDSAFDVPTQVISNKQVEIFKYLTHASIVWNVEI